MSGCTRFDGWLKKQRTKHGEPLSRVSSNDDALSQVSIVIISNQTRVSTLCATKELRKLKFCFDVKT